MRVLVTGGGGFLGRGICRRLVERGDDVRSIARGEYPELHAMGVEALRGDIADADAVLAAAEGCDAIVHTAAKAGDWGSRDSYHRPNVIGTHNVLEACRTHRVGKLVYTSTPSVVHAGGDIEGVDETAPYPDHFEAWYPETKAIAERLVLEANGPSLSTVALRPHLVWGPGDNHLTPKILERGAAGRLRRIGKQPKLIDVVYIDNAVDAHILALDRLEPGAACAGKAYFISQGKPVSTWQMIDDLLAAGGLPPTEKRVSLGTALVAGTLIEWAWRLLPLQGDPPMTRFLARQLATAHWYDISAAQRDLGYTPKVSIEEGLERLREHLARR